MDNSRHKLMLKWFKQKDFSTLQVLFYIVWNVMKTPCHHASSHWRHNDIFTTCQTELFPICTWPWPCTVHINLTSQPHRSSDGFIFDIKRKCKCSCADSAGWGCPPSSFTAHCSEHIWQSERFVSQGFEFVRTLESVWYWCGFDRVVAFKWLIFQFLMDVMFLQRHTQPFTHITLS